MLVRCSWCQKVQGEKPPLDDHSPTDGICRDCYRQKFPCQWVRQVRGELGLTQPALAGLLGVHWQSLAHWEQGLRTPGGPILKLLDRILVEILDQLIQESESKTEKGG